MLTSIATKPPCPKLDEENEQIAAAAELAIGLACPRPLHIRTRDPVAALGSLHGFNAETRPLRTGLQHHGREPLRLEHDVARHALFGQRRTPCFLIHQCFGRQCAARSTPDTTTTVKFLQLAAQGVRSDGLHFVVDGGAHGQTASEKLALAKVLG